MLVSLGSLGGVRTGWSDVYWSVLCCSVSFGVRSVVRGLYSESPSLRMFHTSRVCLVCVCVLITYRTYAAAPIPTTVPPPVSHTLRAQYPSSIGQAGGFMLHRRIAAPGGWCVRGWCVSHIGGGQR